MSKKNKIKAIKKETMQSLIKRNLKAVLILLITVLPATAGFSQDPGGNPDGPPPAVPFDDYMNLIIVAAGVIMAIFILYKRRKIVFS